MNAPRRFVIPASVVGIVLLAALLLYSPFSPAAPALIWTPSSVVQAVPPGESISLPVSFTPSETLPATTVRVVPELAQFVRVNPEMLGSVPKGQTTALTITLAAPAGTPFGVHEGTIELRSTANPTKVFAKPLPVTISVEPPGLPPDPGEAGKAILQGIDIGGGPNGEPNGVRDDIDRYIGFTFPDSEKRRVAMTQKAREDQKFLVDFLALQGNPVEQKRATRANAVERGKAWECLSYTFGVDENAVGEAAVEDEDDLRRAIAVSKKLTAQFLNTHERQQAYLDADELLGGTSGGDRGDDRTLCQEFGFDPDTLQN